MAVAVAVAVAPSVVAAAVAVVVVHVAEEDLVGALATRAERARVVPGARQGENETCETYILDTLQLLNIWRSVTIRD